MLQLCKQKTKTQLLEEQTVIQYFLKIIIILLNIILEFQKPFWI